MQAAATLALGFRCARSVAGVAVLMLLPRRGGKSPRLTLTYSLLIYHRKINAEDHLKRGLRAVQRGEWVHSEPGTGGLGLDGLRRTLACGLRPRTRESAAPLKS